jgi:hypothetical protein
MVLQGSLGTNESPAWPSATRGWDVPRGLDQVGGRTWHIAKSHWADCSSCAPARHWALTQQLAFSGAGMLAGVAPSLDIGQARLCPDPRQLWHVPSGGWEGATRALQSAKQALGLAQGAWPHFGQTWVCSQTALQHHKSFQTGSAHNLTQHPVPKLCSLQPGGFPLFFYW